MKQPKVSLKSAQNQSSADPHEGGMARLLHGDLQWELHIRLFPSQAPVSAPQGIIQLLWGEAVPWRIPWDDYSWAFSLQFPLKLLELWPHECEGAQGSSRGGCNPTEIPFFHELGTFPDPFIFWSEFFTLGDCFAWMSWTQSLQAAEFRDGEGTQRILRKKKANYCDRSKSTSNPAFPDGKELIPAELWARKSWSKFPSWFQSVSLSILQRDPKHTWIWSSCAPHLDPSAQIPQI